jgi:hypothetical protein
MAAPYQRAIDMESSGLTVKNTFLHLESEEDDFLCELPDMRRLVTEPATPTVQRTIQISKSPATVPESQDVKVGEQDASTEEDKSTEGGEPSEQSYKKTVRMEWWRMTSDSSSHPSMTSSDKKNEKKDCALSDSSSSFEPEMEPASFTSTVFDETETVEATPPPMMWPVQGNDMIWPMSHQEGSPTSYPMMMWQGTSGSGYGYAPQQPSQACVATRPQVEWIDPRPQAQSKRIGRRKSKSLITLAQQAQQRQQELERNDIAEESPDLDSPYLAAVPGHQFAVAALAVQERLAARTQDSDHTEVEASPKKGKTKVVCNRCNGHVLDHFRFCQFCGAQLGT